MRGYQIFFVKIQEYDSAKYRPGCLGGSMVLRSGTTTCLIVRGLSTIVVLPVALNQVGLLKFCTCKIWDRRARCSLNSFVFFDQLYNRIITRLQCVPLWFFWNRNLPGQAACARVKFEQSENFEHCWMLKLTGRGRERKKIDKPITLCLKTRSFFKVSVSLVS